MSNIPIFQRTYNRRQVSRVLVPRLIREIRVYLVYLILTMVITVSFYYLIRNYAVVPVEVSGESMFPYHKNKDKIYVDKLTPLFSTYRRGDVVVLKAAAECNPSGDLYIKRVIGLPGEQVIIKEGNVFILDTKLSDDAIKLDEKSYLEPDVKTYKVIIPTIDFNNDAKPFVERRLENDEYYFMGDNRIASLDSRKCGPIKKDQIVGREVYKWFPIDKKGYFSLPIYSNFPN
jgi:signal peptidase I